MKLILNSLTFFFKFTKVDYISQMTNFFPLSLMNLMKTEGL